MRDLEEQRDMLQEAITATTAATERLNEHMRHEATTAALRNQEVQALTLIAMELTKRNERIRARESV